MPTTTTTAQDAIAAALSSLYQSGDYVFSARVPPVGRKFTEGNKVARKFTMETVAQVCALHHLGVTITGIGKILGQMHKNVPGWHTIRNLLDGEAYQDMRTAPGFMSRYEHYISFFENTFRNYPNWKPAGAAIKQAEAAREGAQYKGSGFTPLAQQPASLANGERRAEEAKARREEARARSLAS